MGDFGAPAGSFSHTILGVICALAVGPGGHLMAVQSAGKHLNIKGLTVTFNIDFVKASKSQQQEMILYQISAFLL